MALLLSGLLGHVDVLVIVWTQLQVFIYVDAVGFRWEVSKMSKRTKIIVSPAVYVDHDRKNYYVQVEFPGVKKQDIKLEVSEGGFCVEGARSDADLVGCYFLAHSVNTDKVKAKFENGLLEITIPLKQSLVGKTIPID